MDVKVIINDKETMCPAGTPVGSLDRPAAGLPAIAALVNNDVSSLSYPLTVNSEVKFLTAADPHGWRVYRHSLCFLLARAIRDLFPEAQLSVEHSLGPGLYCSFHPTAESEEGITDDQVRQVAEHMAELVKQDLPIERKKIAYMDAVRAFESSGQQDKLNLLKHRNPPRVVLHVCGDFSDVAHGPLAPSTGMLGAFSLLPYAPGFVLQLPERSDPTRVHGFKDQPHLFHIIQEHREWGRILGVTTVGRLNELIANREMSPIIQTMEALHEKKLARIADQIAAGRDRIKLILVAGPSCAGKTTFAKRLTTHLRVNGIRPVTLATDDYFVGQDRNPIDDQGKPDYEHIEAVDLELFNEDLFKLVNGETVQVPTFNFETKEREYHDRRLHIDEGQVVIIEGIHGLNPRLTEKVPPECEFKIYVSALAQLSVDANNRISTTDNRLMRRIVRDHRFRGHSPLRTLEMWPSVRRGEKRWIFPFQGEAHATFNSALDYELAVLKPLVEPLLMQVKPCDAVYAEARRLSEFLLNFLATSSRPVPGNSILREYIGGSTFRY